MLGFGAPYIRDLTVYIIDALRGHRCHSSWQRSCCCWSINTLRPRQNGRRFADDTFKRIFLNGNVRISIKISLKFVTKGPINNIPALVQIMVWCRPGDKPLSEPMLVSLPTHICVTRPHWVKAVSVFLWQNVGTKYTLWGVRKFNIFFDIQFYLKIQPWLHCIMTSYKGKQIWQSAVASNVKHIISWYDVDASFYLFKISSQILTPRRMWNQLMGSVKRIALWWCIRQYEYSS